MQNAHHIPSAFWWRRLHSLTGFGLVLYLFFHLYTNAQAALWFGDDGRSFIHSVNDIQNTPFLVAVEILILGIPILIHSIWGIYYIQTGQSNAYGYDGHNPYLTYGRNRAYTWQRITSWILLFGLAFHIIHMRFIDHPLHSEEGNKQFYMIKINQDEGIYTLAERIGITLFDQQAIDNLINAPLNGANSLQTSDTRVRAQEIEQEREYRQNLKKLDVRSNQLAAIADNFGAVELLVVREAFKSPWLMLFYTIFVLAACFHAFNGLWTFLITWGVTVNVYSQKIMLYFSTFLMFLVSFLGLITIFGTYWINLRQ